jgi:branched-chain amino acid transport system permease protein
MAINWLEVVIYAVVQGGYYSLMALGLTLVYGIGRIVNLAHGSLIMLGVYAYYVFSTILKIDPFLAIVMAMLLTGIIGAITHRSSIHPVLGDDVAIMVVTLTIGVLLSEVLIMFFTSKTVSIINPLKPFGHIRFLGVLLSWTQVISFFLSVALFFLVTLFINVSKIGKALQAMAQDREAAMLMGINVNALYVLVMIMAAMLAAIGGIMVSLPGASVVPNLWINSIVSTFAIVILGGLGSIKGSLLGSLIVAFSEQIVYYTLPQGGGMILIAPLAVMVAVLLVRPKGLFGKRVEMED